VAWDDLTSAQSAAQNFPEAVKAAQKAFDLRPNDAARLGTLTSLMEQTGQQGQAFSVLERFTATHPRNAQGFLLLADIAERTQKKNIALLSYATFLRLAPNSSLAPAVQQRILLLRSPASTNPTVSTPSTPSAPSGTVPAEPVTP
jgi:cytochrome c-type biogenesis protein CcmH/NrfG